MASITISSNPVVSLNVTSPVNPYGVERRFERSLTISALKLKLELISGGQAGNMKLKVYNTDNKLVCQLDNDEALLGSFQVDDGMVLHVEDPSLRADEFLDTSKVEKFEISADEYAKRTDSVRAFKERNKLGKFNEEEMKRKKEEQEEKEKAEENKSKTMKVNDRCEVKVPGQPTRRGCVQYVGSTDFKPGIWIGVRYDEPHGKNDGKVGDRRYFECPPKYGGFVRPSHAEVGDYPEEDLDLDEM